MTWITSMQYNFQMQKEKENVEIKYYYYYAVIFDKNLHANANAILVQCKMFIRSMFLSALFIFRVSGERGKKH